MVAHGAALAEALRDLAAAGLNWAAFVDGSLGAAPAKLPTSPEHGMLLLLSLGRRFGEQTLERAANSEAHPFDSRACALGDAFISRYFGLAASGVPRVYPGGEPVNLRHWLEVGRVQFRSQMGIGIRSDCGTWFAVRAAYWVALSSAERAVVRAAYPPLEGCSPCESCAERPCVDACPARAIADAGPSLEACVAHRLAPRSSCADRCWARAACPVGVEHAYRERQRAYHYGVSLRSLRRWARGAHG